MIFSSTLLLVVAVQSVSSKFCGCDSCTEEVWESIATDSGGSYTCGGRIAWLQTALNYDEASACAKVSDEFPGGPCVPVCDPRVCNPRTSAPTPLPTPGPTYCGCDTCTQEVYDTFATDSGGSYTCGARINWLRTVLGYDETSACAKVSDEFPDGPCGPVCDPRACAEKISNSPTTQPTIKPTISPSLSPSKKPTAKPSEAPTNMPTTAPSRAPTNRPITAAPTPSPNESGTTYCGCDACTQAVWDTIATDSSGSFTCGGRIEWLQTQGYNELDACNKVGSEFPNGLCGPACACNSSPPPETSGRKCGGAVDFTSNPEQACETYLWGPTGDRTMACFAYGGPADKCSLNNNNDQDDGIFKDPSLCLGDTFYLWDEPDTQGRDYNWAGAAWLEYSQRFSQELGQMRSRGTKVTGPLLKAGSNGVIEQNMRTFFDACGAACFDPSDPAYIDIIAINGFCGPWNDAYGGCRGGAAFIYNEAVSASGAFNGLPVYITNWSRLQTLNPFDQVEAVEAIDEFFPVPSSIVHRVYWFGARDYGGGAQTTGYLTNVLPDGSTLGERWRSKCDSVEGSFV